MAVAKYLVDKSAIARVKQREVSELLGALRTAGLMAMCGMAELEILYSSRGGAEHRRIEADLRETCERLYTAEEDFVRAREVQRDLADIGRHRAVSLPDLLIAAVAERHRAIVLHYDADFDLIAEVTGQPTRWIVPKGSLK
jgi:predicted nucleic acid-binding protein